MDPQVALLAKLQELQIDAEHHHHDAVMTCEAQAQAMVGVAGVGTKNLFLKDKRGKLYIATALVDTEVNLKSLSMRLGTGKGGLRLAPDELIPAILQVPLGSVTPLALCQPSTAGVALLLDAQLQQHPRIFVHPLDNRTTTVLSPADLEAILRSVGREPAWVDFAATPAVDRDNPPDLKYISDAALPLAADDPAAVPEATGAAAAAAGGGGGGSGGKKVGKDAGKKGAAAATAAAADAPRRPRADDVQLITDALIAKIGGNQAGAAGDADGLRRLRADVESELNALRNAAYAAGFAAAKGAIAAMVSGQYM